MGGERLAYASRVTFRSAKGRGVRNAVNYSPQY